MIGDVKNMVINIFIDTNILLDYITKRMPYYTSAWRIVEACDRGIFNGIISAQSVPDIFYILRKSIPISERKEALLLLCSIFDVAEIDREKLTSALMDEDFMDFEDCLQFLCAKSVKADLLVTRNPKDLVCSTIPAILPDDFCKQNLDIIE